MSDIIDVSSACGERAAALKAAGIATLIRYYSRDTIRPSKRLTPEEARQHTAAGLRLAVVHEGRHGDSASNFERDCGVADAVYARSYASDVIRQPPGSTIYFAVDFDASAKEIRDRILPYFQGVADAFAHQSGQSVYETGVYGSGATCSAVLDAGLARRAWLAQSVGWAGHASFMDGQRWSLKQAMPTEIAGVECDPNTRNGTLPIGDFTIDYFAQFLATNDSVRPMRVIARHGLHLRSGPGTVFDSSMTLPHGSRVFPLKSSREWTLVDMNGDGAADGFVSTPYLAEVEEDGSSGTSPKIPAEFLHHIPDAIHIPELVRLGQSPAGLKAARIAAARALPGYPHNGCAAHLSALLQNSGIDVPMTWGAGKLAARLVDRNWTKVAVGAQNAGDVGVCFDNDPKVEGADHIYLVVETHGPDEMTIADNQRTTDAPHERFATGQGRTPTEYFLRAC